MDLSQQKDLDVMTFLGNDFEIMLDHTYTTEKYFFKKKQKQYLQVQIFVFNAAMRKKSS